jgi:hypothetical protein
MSIALLSEAASTGPGNPYTPVSGIKNHTLQLITTGSPTAVVVTLEGCLDTDVYCTLMEYTMSAEELSSGCAIAYLGGYIVDKVRATLSTLTGGTSPTVTAMYRGEEAI